LRWDVIILGAGAAGLMCAIEAGKRGRTVLVLERNDVIGKKIRISGGGRCNFTNLITDPEHYVSANPHFSRSALARYTPSDFLALVERHGIGYHEKKLGQLFCNDSSQQIIDMLSVECRAAGVRIRTSCHVSSVTNEGPFTVATGEGKLSADSLVVATGGLSIPKLGASDFGYRVARQLGLAIVPARPGLVPLRFAQDERLFSELSGVSVDAIVTVGKTSFRENLLFTHRGLSGPAILQGSSYWEPGVPLTLNLSPERDLAGFLTERQRSQTELATALAEIVPKRLARLWCQRFFPSMPLNRYSPAQLRSLAEQLHGWRIVPDGTEGYAKAEVTCGGVDTSELSSKTMESAKVPGLYFIGEVVDVTGHLGGYNFQWAWASGFAAGQAV